MLLSTYCTWFFGSLLKVWLKLQNIFICRCLWDADDVKHISNFLRGIADWATLVECCHVLDNVMPSSKHKPTDLVSISSGEVEMRFLLTFDIVTFTGICKLCALTYMVIQRMLHMPLVKWMALILEILL